MVLAAAAVELAAQRRRVVRVAARRALVPAPVLVVARSEALVLPALELQRRAELARALVLAAAMRQLA